MMLQCATCSNVTVWTRVCMAPWHSSHIWLRSWQTKGHRAREQLHTEVQQPRPGTASINAWLTYILKCRVKVRVLLPSSGSRRWPPSLTYPTDSTGYISFSVTSFCQFPVSGLLTVGRRNRMDKSINMWAWLKVNYDELQDLL